MGLIVKGFKDGLPRGWFFDPVLNSFPSDRPGESDSLTSLLAQAASTNAITFTVVPPKSARRMGVDRDEDGFFDRSELDAGSDPANPFSVPGSQAPVFEPIEDRTVLRGESFSFRVRSTDPDAGNQIRYRLASPSPVAASIDPITGELAWKPAAAPKPGEYRVIVLASDTGAPSLTNRISFKVVVTGATIRIVRVSAEAGKLELTWEALPGRKYRVQFKDSLEAAVWNQLGQEVIADGSVASALDTVALRNHRFYRIEWVP